MSLQDLMYGVPLSGEMPYATDEDSDPITYTSWNDEADPFTMDTMMGTTVKYTGQPVSTGTYTFYVMAEDDHDGFDVATVNVRVILNPNQDQQQNTPPTLFFVNPSREYQFMAPNNGTARVKIVVKAVDQTDFGGQYFIERWSNDETDQMISTSVPPNRNTDLFIELPQAQAGRKTYKLRAVEQVGGTFLYSDWAIVEIFPKSAFNWPAQNDPATGQPYTLARKYEIEQAFLRRLREMRNLGGVAGWMANQALIRLAKGDLKITFSPTSPRSTLGTKDNLSIDPQDVENGFERWFGTEPLGTVGDPTKRFAIVIGHELGHAILGLQDPKNGDDGRDYGQVLILENMIRVELGVALRKYYNNPGDDSLMADPEINKILQRPLIGGKLPVDIIKLLIGRIRDLIKRSDKSLDIRGPALGELKNLDTLKNGAFPGNTPWSSGEAMSGPVIDLLGGYGL